MRKVAVTVLATVAAAVLVAISLLAFGPRSVWWCFLLVWIPMTWLGALSHVVAIRLPDRMHVLRPFERRGRVYEVLGVRVVKRLLRRGPAALWNRGLHLPTEPTPQAVAALDRRMWVAEATHGLLLVAALGVVVHAAVRGWWSAAGWTMLFDVLVNGYPVMLQRYNRALLAQRYPPAPACGAK